MKCDQDGVEGEETVKGREIGDASRPGDGNR